ncbi:MAG: peptidylprolyl isomerase [Desulfobacteraceae bacterium]|nr:peptidylprolyl isomerase [Desulfobacteraceae bacterium]
MLRYIFLFLLVFGIAGCGGDKVATVNGRAVTKDEFEGYLKAKHIQVADEKQKTAVLDKYIERDALATAIEKSNLIDKTLIAAEVNQYRRELLISRYFDQFVKTKIDEKAVSEYYKEHIADYTAKQVHVAHILVITNPTMTAEQRNAKLEIAKKAHASIKSGKSFGEVAKKFSEDVRTASNGGDLGWIKEGGSDKPFMQAAFSLEIGAVSDPIETPSGYQIITVLEGPRVYAPPLSAVAGEIRQKLTADAQKAESEKLIGSIKVKR